MKLSSKEEIADYQNAIMIGGLKGAAVGLAVSVGLRAYLLKRTNFRNYGVFGQTFAFIAPPILFGITNVERASVRFESQRYKTGEYLEENVQRATEVAKMSIGDRLRYTFLEHKYKFITGAWAASLAGSFWYINRDKYMTKSQKIVQARVYAQALTVAILIASMAISVSSPEYEREEREEKDEWKEMVAEEEQKMREHHQSLSLSHPEKQE